MRAQYQSEAYKKKQPSKLPWGILRLTSDRVEHAEGVR